MLIDAHAQSDTTPEPALQAMAALWPATLDAVRQCGGWTATAQAGYMAQLEAMRERPKGADCERLDALADAIENEARGLTRAADALQAVADRRRQDERARLLARAPTTRAGLRLDLGAPAKDLAPVREQMMAFDRCRGHMEWMTAVDRIDEPPGPFQFAPEMPSERASALSKALAVTASELRSVAAAIVRQAVACGAYWSP